MGIQQILFILIVGISLGWAFKQFSEIRKNIFLGKEKEIKGDKRQRLKNMILVAFGQRKMFKKIIPAVLHLFIYVAFLITQIELIEIFIDGIFGTHRIFAPSLGGLYTFIISFIEVLSALALVATVIFLIRRLILNIDRFQKKEMIGWPKKDAILILIGELLLVTGIFMMNGADTVLQDINPSIYHDTGNLAVSSWLGPTLFGSMSESALHIVERTGWWLHLLVVLAFINYLPISKHLHIFLAFPNTYFANLQPRGEMDNMPAIMNEVKTMMEIPVEGEIEELDEDDLSFGAKDIFDLSWKNILDSYTCTECGRCTQQCPANQTGKVLSPRKIIMDVRDRTEEIAGKLKSGSNEFISSEAGEESKVLSKDNFDDGKNLFSYISKEEINACTSCNACVEACPVMINPLEVILDLRRYQILTESAGPAEWTPMFTSLENSGTVWSVPDARDAWTNSFE